MKSKRRITAIRLLFSLVVLVAVTLPFFTFGCGVRYMPKPKVVVEASDPQAAFYASVLALDRLGYRVQAVDTEALTMQTEPRSGGSFWWQFDISVASNGHVAVDTKTDLEIQRGSQTLTHKGIVNRAIDFSRHVRNILYKTPEQQIIAEGSSRLPEIVATPETRLVVPGS
jgi:hypothetical protein